MFELYFTQRAQETLKLLAHDPAKASLVKQIKKTLGYLETNPKHPSLQTHPYSCLSSPFRAGEKVFEAYAQNRTPSAYRIFFCYGPAKGKITVIAITPHP